MKRTVIAAAALAAIAAVPASAAQAAHSKSAGITHQQYANVLVGETKADVQAAFGDNGSVLSRGTNQYGERVWKTYANNVGSNAIITYLKADGSDAYVVIDTVWCTGNLGDGSLHCAP